MEKNPYSSSWTGGGSAPDVVPITTYDYNRANNQTDNNYGIEGATDDERKARTILRLINLPNLKHIYLKTSFPNHVCQNAYSVGNNTNINYLNKEAAAFTTKGCHADLKIHCGSQLQVDEMEKTYGTADTSSTYWTQKGQDFFERYFEPTHRFVV